MISAHNSASQSTGSDPRIYGTDKKLKANPMTFNFDLDLESAWLINGFCTPAN